MSAFDYIRARYGVPAKRGGRVRYAAPGVAATAATILSADGPYLWLRFDGEARRRGPFHPTRGITYLPDRGLPPRSHDGVPA